MEVLGRYLNFEFSAQKRVFSRQNWMFFCSLLGIKFLKTLPKFVKFLKIRGLFASFLSVGPKGLAKP